MTVVIAFASPSRRHSAMCADGLEGNSGLLADKIGVVLDRYAVGITGSDLMKDALAVLGYFDSRVRFRDGQNALSTIRDTGTFCAAIATLVPRLSRFYMKRVDLCLADGRLNEGQANVSREQRGSLILLDLQTHTLAHAKMNCSVAAAASGTSVSFQISRLQPDRVYRISSSAADHGDIPMSALQDFRPWARDEIANVAATENPRFPRAVIGQLGASVEAVDDAWQLWTAFDDYDAYLTSNGIPE